MLEKLFKLKAHHTTVRTEIIAGITTFLAMAYILFVNPSILGATGMDKGSVFVATCLAAAIGSILMGLIANYPIALAPGMGLNAFFTYTVVLHMGYTWQIALGAVFLSAVIFFALSIFKIREWIIASIPLPLRAGIAAGIGLFLALIALEGAGIVVDNPATLVGLGDLTKPGPLLALLGFFIIVVLEARRVTGAVLIGILVVTFISMGIGLTPFAGVFSAPPSIAPTFMQLDIAGAFNVGLVSVIFAFLFVDVFDNTGTLLGVTKRAGLADEQGNVPKMGRALIADSAAALFGSLLGTSTTTSYVESAAGVSAGGRTGLTAIVVAILFLLSLFFSPLAGSVPVYATAPALLFVAVLMASGLAEIDWKDVTTAAPVTVTALTMPLTYSIANGIAFGFITWTVVKLLSGRTKEVNAALVILSILFVIKLGWLSA
ncbi:NCS2 family permease [Pantoea dispersa]|uniref:Guanine permease n=2 Tax=Erwiniaceae TaxID=1903409 RepID=A0A8E1V9A0_9GAMM|nr:NCS2 family permease [Pantoea dispersa]KAA6101921.1 NCS2 family permease [Pantoea sp. B_9]KAA6109687.1 NCS2 family permease [Pantoea sp. B_10]KAF0857473.1 adenine permease [Pantoea dispersa 625]MBK4771104.1 NCS2 family permease [Pantoea sp. Morm]NIE53143.1 NCS2 family permease [Pantoea sp. Ap-870]NIG35582.1 NCS2 family permease [Pantoea sp. Ap-959]PPC66459.1 NCS2 family permease [Pantoea sp. ICBG 828]PPC72755.1 NCS2 family permease [Pantoea sp. ICBG 985]THD39872.1 NCS2 family permease [